MSLRPFAWLVPFSLAAVALAAPAIVRDLRVRSQGRCVPPGAGIVAEAA